MLKKTVILIAIISLVASAGFAQQKDPALIGAGGTADRGPFTLPGETCTGNGGTDCPVAMPDNDPAGVTSSFTFSGCTDIADVNIGLDITHSWVGDLVISVEGPSTTSAVLIDRPGVPASTFGCSDNDIMAVMDDSGMADNENHCNGDLPWISGDWMPVDALAAFNGESADGTWTLAISDNAGGDTGTLNDWSVEVTCAVAPPTVTEIPTVNTWGILAMLGLLGFVAIRVIRS